MATALRGGNLRRIGALLRVVVNRRTDTVAQEAADDRPGRDGRDPARATADGAADQGAADATGERADAFRGPDRLRSAACQGEGRERGTGDHGPERGHAYTPPLVVILDWAKRLGQCLAQPRGARKGLCAIKRGQRF